MWIKLYLLSLYYKIPGSHYDCAPSETCSGRYHIAGGICANCCVRRRCKDHKTITIAEEFRTVVVCAKRVC